MLRARSARSASTDEALALFDSLEPASIEFMLGAWKGEGFLTEHYMDGLLEAYHWYGKRFDSDEAVHPLVFMGRKGNQVLVNPVLVGQSLRLAKHIHIPRSKRLGHLFQCCLPLFRTSRSRARLRMTEFRGKLSATMIYDQLPINDVFRKVDDNTVFGCMDFKGMRQPFFFILRREAGNL